MFKNRSKLTEMLDEPDIPKHLLVQNLKELNFINTWLGGHAVTLRALKKFKLAKNQTYSILEIGCGGGDNLLYLAKWARKNNFNLQFTGVDLKQDCIDFAKLQFKNYPEITFLTSDYNNISNKNKPYDIIFSSLFCHHFTTDQLKNVMAFKTQNSKLGYFINDLHRHPLAYYSIKWLTALFSNSPLVKNDAPISVLRGFKKQDWLALFNPNQTQMNWAWAFRWMIIYKHHDNNLPL